MIAHFLVAGVFPSLWDGICKDATNTDIGSCITSAQDILLVVANGIRIALALAGGLAVIMVVVGGIFYVISAGNPSQIKRARDIITNAIVGLVIASLGYTIVTFIAGRF